MSTTTPGTTTSEIIITNLTIANTTIKHKSYVAEYTDGVYTYNVTFQGTRIAVNTIQNYCSGSCTIAINGFLIIGNVKRNRVYQESGDLWCCDLSWTSGSKTAPTSEPLTLYGDKSSQLEGGLLQNPLENHPNFKTNWKYYLCTTLTEGAIPSWWETANDTISPDPNYKWVETLAELPQTADANGKTWYELAAPTMPGVTHYDIATYIIRESVKCRSASTAGNIVCGKLNAITSPGEDFGIASAVGGEWKCDGANIRWDGKNWIADLTYTLSGDSSGWDERLYS